MCRLKSEGGRCNSYYRSRAKRFTARLNKAIEEYETLDDKYLKNGVPIWRNKELNPEEAHSIEEEYHSKRTELYDLKENLRYEAFRANYDYLNRIKNQGLRLPGKNVSSMRKHQELLTEAVAIAEKQGMLDYVIPQITRSGAVVREWVGEPEPVVLKDDKFDKKYDSLKERAKNLVKGVGDEGSYILDTITSDERHPIINCTLLRRFYTMR